MAKIKIIIPVLFFIFLSCLPMLSAFDLGVPLPRGAQKVMERSNDFGPIKSLTEVYKVNLDKERLFAFFKKEMEHQGWKEQKEGVFIKEKRMAVIVCMPPKIETGTIEFTITVSNIPTKDEIIATRKQKPIPLFYMPLYPKSEQVFYLRMPAGISSAYETEAGIKEVVFFYKTGMLNYGWDFDNELSAQTSQSHAMLRFSKPNGDLCSIEVSESMDKTTIFASYHEKNIKR